MVAYGKILGAMLGAAILVAPAAAVTNLVTNGNFEQVTTTGSYADANTTSFGFGSWNQPRNGSDYVGVNNQVDGWSTSGYSFLFTPGTADYGGHGANGDYGGAIGYEGRLWLWGPDGSGDAMEGNGLPVSPAGGNFIGSNGNYNVMPISQLITGLTVGATYELGFYYAAAQQRGYNGATQQFWTASLGDQSYETTLIENPEHAFSGWKYASTTFTATDTSSLLSFLASGTPNGAPPFLLLDGVSLTQRGLNAVGGVPEPGTWALFLAGFFGMGAIVRRRRGGAATA